MLELGDLSFEALPSGEGMVRVGRVGAVQETEVRGRVVEGGGIGCRVILGEEAGDGGVGDVGRRLGGVSNGEEEECAQESRQCRT